jgi:hypothetical protein
MDYHHPDASPEDIAYTQERERICDEAKARLKKVLDKIVDKYVDVSESDADGAEQCDTWDLVMSLWYSVADKYPGDMTGGEGAHMTDEERWLEDIIF